MVNYISGLVFVILLVLGGFLIVQLTQANPLLGLVLGGAWVLGDAILASAIKLAAQWERPSCSGWVASTVSKGPGCS